MWCCTAKILSKPKRAQTKSRKKHPTLADGLAIPQVGTNGFEIAQSRVDKTVIVTEKQIAISILRMVELEKGVVEGAAATPLAACLSGKLKEFAGKRVILLLSGGNITRLPANSFSFPERHAASGVAA